MTKVWLRHRVSLVIRTIGLCFELVDERDVRIVLSLDDRASILPDPIFLPPLTPRRVALVLMNIVDPQPRRKGLTEYKDPFAVVQ